MMKMNTMNVCCIVFALLAILFLVLYLRQRKRCPSGSVILYNDGTTTRRRGFASAGDWKSAAGIFGDHTYGDAEEPFRYYRRRLDLSKAKTFLKSKISTVLSVIKSLNTKLQGIGIDLCGLANDLQTKGEEEMIGLLEAKIGPRVVSVIKGIPLIGNLIINALGDNMEVIYALLVGLASDYASQLKSKLGCN